MKHVILAAVICAACLDWTRLKGMVKAINLKESTITIMNKDGDLLTVPIDYQVKITEKDEIKDLRHLNLDDKIILWKTVQDKPIEDTSGMAPPERAHE